MEGDMVESWTWRVGEAWQAGGLERHYMKVTLSRSTTLDDGIYSDITSMVGSLKVAMIIG